MGSRKRDHITPILRSLHWLPIQYRIEFKILLIVYKALNNLAPQYLSKLSTEHNPVRSLRSQTSHLLWVSRSRLQCSGDRAFAVAGLKLWKKLSFTVSEFKSLLETYLYSCAFNILCMSILILMDIGILVQHFGQPRLF